jgi:3-hydroxybutyryl-CoA dehydrogenase
MAPARLGVVGAGTMGAGIAQLGCGAGMETTLHDPVPEALERGVEQVRAGLAKWVEKGRADAAAAGLLETAAELDELAECELVIEAAPERPDLKRELFERLSAIAPDAVLATNTSSIPVTSLASAAARPENVVGMHFFNPAPLMKLVEVIAADQTGERALALAKETGEAMGKRVILAADGPGFLVNRCGRPFYTEALRLLQERVATHEQIDRVYRMGGGFRMGPFELMDLVGIDTGFEVAKSFTELSFGEPRWRPNPIQARMVAAGRFGRKSGRGYYDYSAEPYRPADPEPPKPGGGDGRSVVITGRGTLVDGLRGLAAEAGFEVTEAAPDPWLALLLEWDPDLLPLEMRSPRARFCLQSLAEQRDPEAAGFMLLPPLEAARLVELTRTRATPADTCQRTEAFFAALGLHGEWVADAPGLVLGRVVSQLVNEAAFAIGEGVGSADDVDAGLELGLNHPRGPVAWSEAIGTFECLELLGGVWEERREDRYRPAPLLRQAAVSGATLREEPWRPQT